MKLAIFIFLALISIGVSSAQEKEKIFETKPEYPGGMQEFYKYVTSNLKLSSKQLKKLKGGKLFIQFVINPEGYVDSQSVSSIKGMTTIEDLDAITKTEDLVKKSPQWKPGTRNGEAIEMRLVLPINF